jgi:hypothetical protein
MSADGIWTWKVGILVGIGEAAFQTSGDKVRRITRIIAMPDGGMVLAKSACEVLVKEGIPEYFSSVILADFAIKDEMVKELDRVWEGGRIIQANGGMRLAK